MNILGLDTSSQAVSAAIWHEDKLLGEFFLNNGLTHSQTAAPLIDELIKKAGIGLSEIDCFAVTTGPGSFTGLRIGLSLVKGLAQSLKKPCIPVSTLESLAYNCIDHEGLICPVMDARVKQVYTALFCASDQEVTQLWQDMAIGIEELGDRLLALQKPVLFVGDGATLVANILAQSHPLLKVSVASAAVRYQRAAGVLMAAMNKQDQAVTAEMLVPSYLRLPQAERERLLKEQNP